MKGEDVRNAPSHVHAFLEKFDEFRGDVGEGGLGDGM